MILKVSFITYSYWKYVLKSPHIRAEIQNTETQDIMKPSASNSMLTLEDRNNVELIKKNHDWKENYITISKESGLEKKSR